MMKQEERDWNGPSPIVQLREKQWYRPNFYY